MTEMYLHIVARMATDTQLFAGRISRGPAQHHRLCADPDHLHCLGGRVHLGVPARQGRTAPALHAADRERLRWFRRPVGAKKPF